MCSDIRGGVKVFRWLSGFMFATITVLSTAWTNGSAPVYKHVCAANDTHHNRRRKSPAIECNLYVFFIAAAFGHVTAHYHLR